MKQAPKELRDSVKGVSGGFHESFKSVPKKFQEEFKSFNRALVRVFQGGCVIESSLLHVTHRSYPSRRRACLLTSSTVPISTQATDAFGFCSS